MTENISPIVEAIFRQEQGRVLAALISQLGDFTLAEDALQDALLIALEKWGSEGIPHNPGAWITTIARRRAVDRLRRESTSARKQAILADLIAAESSEDDDMDSIPDERLKLMFTCCHPSLALEAQVALTLRTLGGLSTEEVARAFLVPVPTMAQRLARAKTKIRDAGIPYRVPPAHLLPERLDALLTVLYLIFNEGYCATSGDVLIRHDLCREAIRLCRVLITLLPENTVSVEATGLLALMLLHDSRRNARTSSSGDLIVLEDQDRSIWDHAQIEEGIEILEKALGMGSPGPYQIQAAISAVHAQAKTAADTDWKQIMVLYYALATMVPSPVIEVNRAVAIGMADGPLAGLDFLMQIEGLDEYYPFHAARADLLRRSHQFEAAADAYEQALALCQNTQEWAYLQRRLKDLTLI